MQVYINNIIRGYAEIEDSDWFNLTSAHPVIAADIVVKTITLPADLTQEFLTIECQSFDYSFEFKVKTDRLIKYSTKLLLGLPVTFVAVLEGVLRSANERI